MVRCIAKRRASAFQAVFDFPMKYSTRLTTRQVLLAFDLYIKRLQVLSSRHEGIWIMLKRRGHKPLDKPTRLPPNLSLKAIAARCRMSTGTLAAFISEDFRMTDFNRAKLEKFARKYRRP